MLRRYPGRLRCGSAPFSSASYLSDLRLHELGHYAGPNVGKPCRKGGVWNASYLADQLASHGIAKMRKIAGLNDEGIAGLADHDPSGDLPIALPIGPLVNDHCIVHRWLDLPGGIGRPRGDRMLPG